MNLKNMGWDDSFGECEHEPARVIVVDRDRYIVKTEIDELSAKLSGKFRFSTRIEDAYPCVGDWVFINRHEGESTATIHRILQRKSFLRRKSAGKNIEYQMIGANIDIALIVQSCHFDFNVRRLERYLVMVNEGNIEPVIILTKVDLVSSDELREFVDSIRHMGIDTSILALSNVTGVGIDEIQKLLTAGKTYCLVGSSGVGKTTLINRLIENSVLETKTVSGTGEGRHTTVRRQLIMLNNGSMLIDTPGMRELGIVGASSGIEDSYKDIAELARTCRFSNCSHTIEPGCSVLKALKDKTLDIEHYNNYLKIKKESDFYKMSYSEKRKKDRDFGKMVHLAKKEKHK
jgi:ribosome biogenesis GTPase